MAGWCAWFCENNRDPHLAGPCLPHLLHTSLTAPSLTRSSEQAVERVLGLTGKKNDIGNSNN